MMFDWEDPDQVNETIWGELNQNEDHTVPYPKDSEELPAFTSKECNKKEGNDDTGSIPQSAGQSSGARDEFPGCVENSSCLASEDHSSSRLEMDPWPDLPSLNSELNTGYNNGSNDGSLEQGLINKMTVQLDGEPEPFGSARDDKGNGSFLDCDWANINDFDDLDRMFRNESIFGHDMVTNMDELLSSSSDMIGSSMQSIPMPDITLTSNQPSDQCCSSFQLAEHSGDKRKMDDKTADTVETREPGFSQTPQSNQLAEMDDRKKKLLKSRKKAEERSKNKASQNFHAPWPENIGQTQQLPGQNIHPFVMAPSQAIPSPVYAQQRKVNDAENIGSSQFMYTQYGYPAYPFHGIPVMQHVQADNYGRTNVPIGNYPDPLNYSNSSNIVPEMHAKALAMTPQEKIEKLRRRQQAQAMLAIQQQQQQFGHQIMGAEDTVSQEKFQRNKGQGVVKSDSSVEENENKLPPLGLNILHEHDSSKRINALTDDNSSGKIIYCQLQDSLRKLDIRVRLCIRDSLLRLARSSMERQNASDRNSTNKSTKEEHEVPVHEDMNTGERHTRLPDAETYTNPIDRTVAQLLFHRPLDSGTRPMNDEVPQSPMLHNPIPKMPLNIDGTLSEGGPESYGDLDMQPS